jgi:hypothetical protein
MKLPGFPLEMSALGLSQGLAQDVYRRALSKVTLEPRLSPAMPQDIASFE